MTVNELRRYSLVLNTFADYRTADEMADIHSLCRISDKLPTD